jgi:hypothetical protein
VSIFHAQLHASGFNDSQVQEDSIEVNENGRGGERDGGGGGGETGSPLSSTFGSSLYFALRAEHDRHQILKSPLHSDFIYSIHTKALTFENFYTGSSIF